MTIKTKLKAVSIAALAITLAACSASEETGEAGGPTGEAIADIDAPDGQNWAEMASETPEGGFLIGNPDAPIKLVEYASHTCGACANFSAQGASEIESAYVPTGKVSFEIRNLVRDPLDLTIAMAARCGPVEAFHPIAGQAWANLQQIGQAAYRDQAAYEAAMALPPEQRFLQLAQLAGLPQFFAERGVSVEQLGSCLADGDKASEIYQRSNEQAAEMDITGTPTFFLNGQQLTTNSWSGVEEALQAAGAR